MMRKMKERVREKEGEAERERVYTRICVCGVSERERKKKSQTERKDYIGDFGFRVSSGRKADFPIFHLSRNKDRHSN